MESSEELEYVRVKRGLVTLFVLIGISQGATGEQLKQKVHELTKVPVEKQRLMFDPNEDKGAHKRQRLMFDSKEETVAEKEEPSAHRRLDEHSALKAQGVKYDSVIHLVLKGEDGKWEDPNAIVLDNLSTLVQKASQS
mmetsp:Transcript_4851/g.14637  ORF Transcript_4851/g.14637 Transcript_4851/m.14637 type:complete len:138 (+) Transcript_4851:219-632(+)